MINSKLAPPMHLLPPGAALAPIARPPPGLGHPGAHHQGQSQAVVGGGNFQTQPLDLGVERSGSPKRKASAVAASSSSSDSTQQPVALEITKKRRMEDPSPPPVQQQQQQQQQQPQQQQQQTQQVQQMQQQRQPSTSPPMLSRVSEPSPLIASAATSITTVVNTALLTQSNSQSQVCVNKYIKEIFL